MQVLFFINLAIENCCTLLKAFLKVYNFIQNNTTNDNCKEVISWIASHIIYFTAE